MASRNLTLGTIFDKTLAVIERTLVPSLAFIAGITVITGAINWFLVEDTRVLVQLAAGLANFAVGITASYLLLDAMLGKLGLRVRTSSDVFLPYLGLSILYTLGVVFGFICLILPGLFFMARWAIAQPMLMARGTGITESLGASWEEMRGSEFQVLGAFLGLYILPVAALIAGSVALERTSLAGIAVSQALSALMSVLGLALGVAIYGLVEARKAAAAAAPR